MHSPIKQASPYLYLNTTFLVQRHKATKLPILDPLQENARGNEKARGGRPGRHQGTRAKAAAAPPCGSRPAGRAGFKPRQRSHGSRSPAGRGAASPRPWLLPTREGALRGPSGSPARSSTRGHGARSAKAAGPRGQSAGRAGTGARGVYRPAPRAAAAVPRGSGSSTIVSGCSGGGSRAGPALSRRRHPARARGGGRAAERGAARPHGGCGPTTNPRRRRALDSGFLGLPCLLAWPLTIFWNVAPRVSPPGGKYLGVELLSHLGFSFPGFQADYLLLIEGKKRSSWMNHVGFPSSEVSL
ncbi:uncharacterized protein [Manis javanica]|uniref:uncharacterized protein n=1 Tax=Manis javanica TaxID=9974 RepID=UPI003C6D5A33